MTKKKYHERSDKALCYLINILGYAKKEIEGNAALFSKLSDFLCTPKARLMSKTKLIRVYSDADVSNVEDEENNTCDKEEIKLMNKVEQALSARLPRDKYNNLVKKINVVGKE